MRRSIKGFCFILIVSLLFPLQVNAAAPLDTVQAQINKILAVLRDPALKSESAKKQKEERVWSIIESVFDFTELSKRTLSRDWKKLSPDQQKEFTALLGKLLGNVYMDRLMKYTDEKVVFTKESMLSEKRAEVQSKILSQGREIPIHYRMFLKSGEWKVYDVLIEGVSLTKNYRSQFKSILMKNSPEKMLEMLRKKVGDA